MARTGYYEYKHCYNVTKSLASWEINFNLARIQSVTIKQTFEELSLIRSGSIYDSGRIVVLTAVEEDLAGVASLSNISFCVCIEL